MFRQGDMFENLTPDVIPVVTTNSVIKEDGSLVMGGGAAKQAADLFPGLPALAGAAIQLKCASQGVYGLIFVMVPVKHCAFQPMSQRIGLFQVKKHYNKDALLDLIDLAADKLLFAAQLDPTMQFRLNFPGIGLGGLTRERVLPKLKLLETATNITVWEF